MNERSTSDGGRGASDIDVECRFYAELSELLLALSGNYRVLADLLPGFGPADRDVLREKVLRITRRTFDAARITVAILERKPVSEVPE